MRKDFTAANWEGIFACNGLKSFEDFWNYRAEWFETPNQRRGGWSGAARCELKHPDGGSVRVFLKRQEDHTTRTASHPLRGVPTLLREFRNIQRYQRLGIASLTWLYFGWRCVEGHQRAVLITEELAGFRSLEALGQLWAKRGWPPAGERGRVIRAVALFLRRLHSHRLQHNCFYPKHIFLREDAADGGMEVRVIDLEKTKWRLFGDSYRDLRTLNRHSCYWRRADRVRFFKEYLGLRRLTPEAKALWRRIARREMERHPEEVAAMTRSLAVGSRVG